MKTYRYRVTLCLTHSYTVRKTKLKNIKNWSNHTSFRFNQGSKIRYWQRNRSHWKRVKTLVQECVTFAEESPYPDVQQLYDVVYAQEDYPFYLINYKSIMATIITMPRLSDTMTEGTVAAWLKKSRRQNQRRRYSSGNKTDKATMEFESFHEGTLCILVYQKAKQQR
jgi:hypothetical protein